MYGKDFFENSVSNLQQIFEMANLSMYNKEPPIIMGNNMEGALLLHMTLQNLDGNLIECVKHKHTHTQHTKRAMIDYLEGREQAH